MPIAMYQRALQAFAVFVFFAANPAFSAIQPKTGKGLVEEFQIESIKMKTLVPEDWAPVTGVLNTPLALLSKKGAQDVRTVIQIVPYGVKDTQGDFQKFKKDPDEFYSQKEEMLEGLDGESISYEPFTETVKDGATIQSIGIKYENLQGRFLDKTWYISSKSKDLFYVKAMIPLDLESEHVDEVNRVIASISSQN